MRAHSSSPNKPSSLDPDQRPAVSSDLCILTLAPEGSLAVVVVKIDGEYQLPGAQLEPGERLVDAARRAALTVAGIEVGEVHQLRVFDSPTRDARGWVLSAAHFAAVPHAQVQVAIDGIASASAEAYPVLAVPVEGGVAAGLKWDHSEIVAQAVKHLRREYELRPDPYRFVAKREVTMLELRTAHEAVAGHRILKDSFRRLMQPKLFDTANVTQGLLGKPARLFMRKDEEGPRAVHHSDWNSK